MQTRWQGNKRQRRPAIHPLHLIILSTQMGRNKFAQKEIDEISRLLRLKNAGNRKQQKEIRHELRVEYEFNISDFNEQGKAFGPDELRLALDRGAIEVLDDATIADMKAKRLRDKARDEALRQRESPADATTDWQQAMKEWESWQARQPEKPASSPEEPTA